MSVESSSHTKYVITAVLFVMLFFVVYAKIKK